MQILSVPFFGAGAFESIATTTLSTSTATITFSSIPATYKHLQIRYIAKTTNAAASDICVWRLNSDTATNYSRHYLYGDGASAVSGAGVSDTRMMTDGVTGANHAAGTFGTGIVDILDYANTDKYKTLRALTGYKGSAGGLFVLNSGNWRSTSAVTSITITSNSTASFIQYSQFALYGIKG